MRFGPDFALPLALALCASAPALAGSGAEVERVLFDHLSKGVPEAKVGDWVTYRLSGPGRTGFFRFAVVGEEKDELGRDAQWIEFEFGEHHEFKSPLGQIRMLIAKGQGMAKDGITRMFWGTAFGPPQELSREALAHTLADKPKTPKQSQNPAGAPRSAKIKADTRFTTGGETRLLTLAGTVDAVPVDLRYRSTVVQRFWISRQIPVLQLAKLEIPAIGHAMEVRDFGRDAKPMMRLPPREAPKVMLHSVEENFPWGKVELPEEVRE